MGVFSLRLDEETHEKLRLICEKQSRSQNKQMEYIVRQFISDYEKVNGTIESEEFTSKRKEINIKKR